MDADTWKAKQHYYYTVGKDFGNYVANNHVIAINTTTIDKNGVPLLLVSRHMATYEYRKELTINEARLKLDEIAQASTMPVDIEVDSDEVGYIEGEEELYLAFDYGIATGIDDALSSITKVKGE